MSHEYYGPKFAAENVIHKLLNLKPTTERHQDWYIEFADPNRIGEMLDLFESDLIDFECKSALALLIIYSIEQAFDSDTLTEEQMSQASQLFKNNLDIQSRMDFYLIRTGIGPDPALVKKIIGL